MITVTSVTGVHTSPLLMVVVVDWLIGFTVLASIDVVIIEDEVVGLEALELLLDLLLGSTVLVSIEVVVTEGEATDVVVGRKDEVVAEAENEIVERLVETAVEVEVESMMLVLLGMDELGVVDLFIGSAVFDWPAVLDDEDNRLLLLVADELVEANVVVGDGFVVVVVADVLVVLMVVVNCVLADDVVLRAVVVDPVVEMTTALLAGLLDVLAVVLLVVVGLDVVMLEVVGHEVTVTAGENPVKVWRTAIVTDCVEIPWTVPVVVGRVMVVVDVCVEVTVAAGVRWVESKAIMNVDWPGLKPPVCAKTNDAVPAVMAALVNGPNVSSESVFEILLCE